MPIAIRTETEADLPAVDAMIRRAFYNLYQPGCHEHYLAAMLRGHPDFLPDLNLVVEENGAVLANIMYTKATLVGADGGELPILTFGPLCVEPMRQRCGLGKALMAESFRRAVALGHRAVVIFGNPGNYVSSGFVSCARHGVTIDGAKHPAAMLVKELVPGAIAKGAWRYRQSAVYEFDPAAAEAYDASLPPMEKKIQASQEEFFILSRANLAVGAE